MNAIFNAISMKEFKRILNVEIAHTTWNVLQTMHESFDEFYAKLNDIVNSAFNLGKSI